jgi:hypothetical protein
VTFVAAAREALAGETAIDSSVASDTVKVVEGVRVLSVPNDAVIVVEAGTPEAAALKTFGNAPLLAATVSSDDAHVARLVRSRVLPSLNVPVAENVIGVSFAIVGLAGNTVTETRFDKSTLSTGWNVSTAVDCPPKEALTSNIAPTSFPIASPLYAVMNGPDVVQFAWLVTSCVDKSLNVAIALYCCWFSNPIVTAAGVTAREVTVVPVTVSCALFETLPDEALITTVPGAMPVASPCVGELLLTVAMLGSRQDHCAAAVKSFVLPSEYFPVAVNAWVVPSAIVAVAGLIAMDCKVAVPPDGVVEVEAESDFELPPPQPASSSKPAATGISNNLRIIVYLWNRKKGNYSAGQPFS